MHRYAVAAITTMLLLAGCTSSEGDEDGLDEATELQGWNVTVTDADCNTVTRAVTSDPALTDTDGDGVNDFAEFTGQTDPLRVDTDGDGLKDGNTVTLDEGDPRLDAWRRGGIAEIPEGSRTFPGENGFDLEGTNVRTDARKANTDSGCELTDELADLEEVRGWDITIDGETRRVTSDPSAADTDLDGMHDGLERTHRTDPRMKDTDKDGTGDLQDAFPHCDARVSFQVKSFNLKQNMDPERLPGGGADLKIDLSVAGVFAVYGPVVVAQGANKPTQVKEIDLPDEGGGLPAAGKWEGDIGLIIWDHDPSTDDQPIRVKGGQAGNTLLMRYDAVEERWTGDAPTGTSDGPDARIEFVIRTLC